MKRARARIASVVATTIAALLASEIAQAAEEVGLGVTYDPRVPIGSFRGFAPNVAFSGLQAKWDYFPTNKLSTGVELQYNLFQNDVASETVSIPNGAVNAATFRYLSLWSLIPTARYYFAEGVLRPWVGLGAGVSSSTSAILVSDLSRRETGWAFIAQPSAGVFWQLSRERHESLLREPTESIFGLTASVAYAFTTADVIGASNVGFAGVQVGVYAKP